MIDTHCHIDEEAFAEDREEVIARQREAGVKALVVPGVNRDSIATVMDVCHRHKGYCFPALGLHPEDVKANWQEELAAIEYAIRANRNELVAIGEIGLDYYWDKTYKEEQKEVLRRQLLLARELELPVILHNRESTEDILRILKDAQMENGDGKYGKLTGVFHCFNGSRETAAQVLEMGLYLGIGGVLTFKNCKLGEALRGLRQSSVGDQLLERIVLETDAPYMAPVPHRGERNESRLMIHIVDRLAEVFECTPDDVIVATSRNACELFRLK